MDMFLILIKFNYIKMKGYINFIILVTLMIILRKNKKK